MENGRDPSRCPLTYSHSAGVDLLPAGGGHDRVDVFPIGPWPLIAGSRQRLRHAHSGSRIPGGDQSSMGKTPSRWRPRPRITGAGASSKSSGASSDLA